jgi:hypothetical protein
MPQLAPPPPPPLLLPPPPQLPQPGVSQSSMPRCINGYNWMSSFVNFYLFIFY